LSAVPISIGGDIAVTGWVEVLFQRIKTKEMTAAARKSAEEGNLQKAIVELAEAIETLIRE